MLLSCSKPLGEINELGELECLATSAGCRYGLMLAAGLTLTQSCISQRRAVGADEERTDARGLQPPCAPACVPGFNSSAALVINKLEGFNAII